MVRKRLRVREGGRKRRPEEAAEAEAPNPYATPDDGGTDGFSIAFSGGRGVLVAEGVELTEAVMVDRLEMIISGLSFPFDITGGVKGLRHRRHVLGRLKMTVTLDGLLEMARARLKESAWSADLQIAFEQGHVAALLEYGPEGSRLPVSFRLLPAVSDDSLTLLIDEPRAYGPLPANALLVAAASLQELVGMRPEGPCIELPDPIKLSLFSILPTRGWRIPDHSKARLSSIEIFPDRVVLEFTHIDLADGLITTPLGGGEAAEIMRLRKLEETRMTRDADAQLTDGRVAEARSSYAKMLTQDPENPFLAARLAMIDVTDPEMRDTALSLLAEASARHQGRGDLAAATAHGAALAGDMEAEEEALAVLVQESNSLERLAAGLRRGQLLIEDRPERAVEALQGALSARREDRRALASLLEALAQVGDTAGVRSLIPRWIASHKRADERAAAYTEVGQILLQRLGDPREAAKHFERAALSDPKNMEALWGLAESLAGAGDVQRALSQFERLERIAREADDTPGAARALGAVGRVWMTRNEPGLAVQRLREALALDGQLVRERVLLADGLRALDRPAEAAKELETALGRAGDLRSESWWTEAALDLARVYLDELDDPGAAEPWAREALANPELEVKARECLLSALEGAGRLDVLASELEKEVDLFPAPETALRLVDTLEARGDLPGALSAIEHAARRFPDSAELLDRQIEVSRAVEDHVGLRDSLARRVESVASSDRRSLMEVEIGQLDLIQLEDPAGAVPWFKRALEHDPASAEARQGLTDSLDRLMETAGLLFESGEHAASREIFRTVRREGEGDVVFDAALGEAESALKLGDMRNALEAAMTVESGAPELTARAAQVAAGAFMELEAPDEAVRHLEQAAAQHAPDVAADLLLLGAKIAAHKMSDLDRSREILEKVVEIDPEHEEADKALERLFESSGGRVGLAGYYLRGTERGDWRERMEKAAEILLEEREFDGAADALRGIYERTGELGDARSLARALKEAGRVEDLTDLVRERQEADGFADEHLLDELEMMADLLESREELEAAATVTEELASISDTEGVRSARAARLAQATGQEGRARRLWTAAIEIKSEPAWIARLAELLDPSRDEEELNDLFDRVDGTEEGMDLEDRLRLLDARVDRELAVDREDEAIELIEKMIDVAPERRPAWERMQSLLSRRGKWEQLAKQMTRRIPLLTAPGEIADANLELGRLLGEKLGDELGAQAAFDEALRLVPDHEEALKCRAALAYERHKWDRLEKLLTRMRPDIDDQEVDLWRAATHEHAGRSAEAHSLYRKIYEADPTNVAASRGLARLEKDAALEDKLSNAFEKLRRE